GDIVVPVLPRIQVSELAVMSQIHSFLIVVETQLSPVVRIRQSIRVRRSVVIFLRKPISVVMPNGYQRRHGNLFVLISCDRNTVAANFIGLLESLLYFIKDHRHLGSNRDLTPFAVHGFMYSIRTVKPLVISCILVVYDSCVLHALEFGLQGVEAACLEIPLKVIEERPFQALLTLLFVDKCISFSLDIGTVAGRIDHIHRRIEGSVGLNGPAGGLPLRLTDSGVYICQCLEVVGQDLLASRLRRRSKSIDALNTGSTFIIGKLRYKRLQRCYSTTLPSLHQYIFIRLIHIARRTEHEGINRGSELDNYFKLVDLVVLHPCRNVENHSLVCLH